MNYKPALIMMRTKIYDCIRDEYTKVGIGVNSEDQFKKHIDWYIDGDMIAIAADDEDRIWALGMARPLAKSDDILEPFAYDADGKVVAVDFLVASIKEDVEYLFDQLLDKYPQVETIAFQRVLKGRPRVITCPIHRIKQLSKLIGIKGL